LPGNKIVGRAARAAPRSRRRTGVLLTSAAILLRPRPAPDQSGLETVVNSSTTLTRTRHPVVLTARDQPRLLGCLLAAPGLIPSLGWPGRQEREARNRLRWQPARLRRFRHVP
jgi:hypothetical protein